jgi:hypothetical protein
MKGGYRHMLGLQVTNMELVVLITDDEIGGIWDGKMLES